MDSETSEVSLMPPRPPMGAFRLFATEERKKSRTEDQITFINTGRVLGRRWRELRPEVRESYEEMSRREEQRFREEMQSFTLAALKPVEDYVLFLFSRWWQLHKESPSDSGMQVQEEVWKLWCFKQKEDVGSGAMKEVFEGIQNEE